jgi:hypothetical protein
VGLLEWMNDGKKKYRVKKGGSWACEENSLVVCGETSFSTYIWWIIYTNKLLVLTFPILNLTYSYEITWLTYPLNFVFVSDRFLSFFFVSNRPFKFLKMFHLGLSITKKDDVFKKNNSIVCSSCIYISSKSLHVIKLTVTSFL